jgi:preprotein translocase subunit SecF
MTKFSFLIHRYKAFVFSAILLVISIASLAWQGLNFGIDFTGGTVMELIFEQPVDLSEVREKLAQNNLSNAIAQFYGTSSEVMLRVPPQRQGSEAEISSQVLKALASFGNIRIQKVEFIGPNIGRELTEQGVLALLFALGGILIYVAFRFEWRFAVSSVAALFHDVLIVVGLFSLFRWNFDLTVLAALLAVIGYSLNDTIVVFDRIRENFQKQRKIHDISAMETMNTAINQTLSRTLLTSLTTLFVLFTLLIFGGSTLQGFALALFLGIVIGTYSSIFVASPLALELGVKREHFLPNLDEENTAKDEDKL